MTTPDMTPQPGEDAQLTEYKNRIFATQTVDELLRVVEGIEEQEGRTGKKSQSAKH